MFSSCKQSINCVKASCCIIIKQYETTIMLGLIYSDSNDLIVRRKQANNLAQTFFLLSLSLLFFFPLSVVPFLHPPSFPSAADSKAAAGFSRKTHYDTTKNRTKFHCRKLPTENTTGGRWQVLFRFPDKHALPRFRDLVARPTESLMLGEGGDSVALPVNCRILV